MILKQYVLPSVCILFLFLSILFSIIHNKNVEIVNIVTDYGGILTSIQRQVHENENLYSEMLGLFDDTFEMQGKYNQKVLRYSKLRNGSIIIFIVFLIGTLISMKNKKAAR